MKAAPTLVLALFLCGCHGSKAGSLHVRIRNQGERPVTLWTFLPDKTNPSSLDWKSSGVVEPHTDGEFDLDLDKLGLGKNVRLQPGAGPVQMTELSPATAKGSGSVTLTMKADETMDVKFD